MPEPHERDATTEMNGTAPNEITMGDAARSETACEFWHVLPVRYAICHPPEMYRPQPLGADLPPLNHFDYTLRKLRAGWVHLRYRLDGVEHRESHYYDGTNFTCRKTVEGGGAITIKGGWIRIPKKVSATKMAFSPAAWSSEVWDACTFSGRMQDFTVDPEQWKYSRTEDKWCAPIDRLGSLVEEYKKTPGQLRSLAHWKSEIFAPLPDKEEHINDSGRTKSKIDAVVARWAESAEEFQWLWNEDGKSSLQDAMEQACPSPGDAYFIGLYDPIGCTQDMASINICNTRLLALYNNWYGYPQLMAEMADRYIQGNGGKDIKQVLANRQETYKNFLDTRAEEAQKIGRCLDDFFADWETYLKQDAKWNTHVISMLADEFPQGTNRAEKRDLAVAKENEFSRCLSMISSHNQGKEIIKRYFFNKTAHGRQFALLKEVLAGGAVSPDPTQTVVVNMASDNLATVLVSIRTAMLDCGNQTDKSVYRELMDVTANRLSVSANTERGIKYYPPVSVAHDSQTVPITLNAYGLLLERCLRQMQEGVEWTDWTQEMPKPAVNKRNTLEDFAQYSSLADTTGDATEQSLDLAYIRQTGTFPPRGSAMREALKAFKGIVLPVAIVTNAAVLIREQKPQDLAGLFIWIFNTSLSVNMFTEALTLFKPALVPQIMVAGGVKISQDAAVKIIGANIARFIGVAGTLIQGVFTMRDLFANNEITEVKVGYIFSCLGQLLMLSFNPVGVVLGAAIAIGGTAYSAYFKRVFEDDWFRTSYWGRDYHGKVKKYPSFSLKENRIDSSEEIVGQTGEGAYARNVTVVEEFKKSLESYIYYGQSPNLHIYVENSDAYVAIVAPTFKHGHTSVRFEIQRVDDTWKQSQEFYLKGLDSERERELQGAIPAAERKADEKIAPSKIRYLYAWKSAYEAERIRLTDEIEAKYKEKKKKPYPEIDWSSKYYYKVPMRMRIVEGAACCEMVLDLDAISKSTNSAGSAKDVTLELIAHFKYENAMKEIQLPLPDSKTFRATNGVNYVPWNEWKRHTITYQWKPSENERLNYYDYIDSDVYKWAFQRYHKIIKQG